MNYHIRSEAVASEHNILHLVYDYNQRVQTGLTPYSVAKPTPTTDIQPQPHDKRTRVIDAYIAHPHATIRQVAKLTGVSVPYTGEILKELRTHVKPTPNNTVHHKATRKRTVFHPR